MKKRTLGNDTLTYHEYDDVGRVSKVDNRKSDLSVISTFEYEHDKVGNPTKITETASLSPEDGSATYYQYDRIYQLTGETQVDDQGQVEYAFEYQYDKAHNRTVKVDNGTPTYYTYNEANELTEETTDGQTTYYQYDCCGNTVAKQEAAGTTYYQYDTENLMTRIDFADGGHSYFTYDADSKRVSKEDSEGYTEFIYQGPDMLKLLMERDDQGETQAHYTMGQGLEAMRRANGDGIASGASSFYHYNHLGTTHELTDANEDVTDTYRHDAWGVPLARTGTSANPHTYVGRERYYWVPAPAIYELGFRQYAVGLGRFLTVDPILRMAGAFRERMHRILRAPEVRGFRDLLRQLGVFRSESIAGEELTWYRYGEGLPTLRVDPSGLQSVPAPPPTHHEACDGLDENRRLICEFCMTMWDVFFVRAARAACNRLPLGWLRRCCIRRAEALAGRQCRAYGEWDPGLVDQGYLAHCTGKMGNECDLCCQDFLRRFGSRMPDDVRSRTEQNCLYWCDTKRPEE